MRPGNYAFALMMVMAGLFLAVIGTNLIIDPEAVLGTGMLGRSLNANDRYLEMRAYQTLPDRYDGVLFASSRGGAVPLDELSRRMDGATFANFAVTGGQIADHLAVLEYIVRSKTAQGKRLRAAFLLLDADLFGERPYGNRTIQSFWPPALTGESSSRFIWRYLTAIQFGAWRSQIEYARSGRGAVLTEPSEQTQSQPTHVAESKARSASAAIAADAGPAIGRTSDQQGELITSRSDFERQLAQLAKFVDLCGARGIKLAVALSPLRRTVAIHYDQGDIAKTAERIAEIVPVWDFGSPQWLSDRTDLWFDNSHFRPEVAKMMLDRMFAGDVTNAPKDFGILRH